MMRVVAGILAILSVVVGQTCFEGPGGASMTETKAGGHNIQVLGGLPFLTIYYVFDDLPYLERKKLYLGDQGNHWETRSGILWHSCSEWRI